MNILIITTLAVGGSTVSGVILGLLIRTIPRKYNDAVLGAAACIMLGAAVIGLILPAAGGRTPHALILTVTGVFCGAILGSLLDRMTPHLHRLAGPDQESHSRNQGISRILLFTAAIALHKFPEGVAAGVSFGSGELENVLTVAGSISLQNIPETMVIVGPLLAAGVSMRRTVLISLGIGMIGMAGTLTGYALVSWTVRLMPFMLALAGGEHALCHQ